MWQYGGPAQRGGGVRIQPLDWILTSVPGPGIPARSCTANFGRTALNSTIRSTAQHPEEGIIFPFSRVGWQQLQAPGWTWRGHVGMPFPAQGLDSDASEFI